jgi:hypothetical protein
MLKQNGAVNRIDQNVKNTGGKFRSYVLRVMSPQSETARFLCAMPVMCFRV